MLKISMKANNLFILLTLILFGNACAKKDSAGKQVKDQLPKLVTIDFDKIDAEKANKVSNEKNKNILITYPDTDKMCYLKNMSYYLPNAWKKYNKKMVNHCGVMSCEVMSPVVFLGREVMSHNVLIMIFFFS